MATKTSPAQLISLDAVVLDTETTGPDAANARLIQFGAVRISRGHIVDSDRLEMLVKPEVAIPPRSTAIHGISDKDVAVAPAFSIAYPKFAAFIGDAVVIGHSIGFDLAVLKRECELSGVAWRRPRTLDTRLLARLARPTLNDVSLDTLANVYDVTIDGRHQALGDAIATARIFLALVPALRERGIRTLAQAEAACRNLSEELMNFHAAGWEDPVAALQRDSVRPLASVDSFPYRHRIKDVMSAPPVFVTEDLPLKQLIELLIARRISSVFVETQDGGPGIVTERDALRAIAAMGADAFAASAGSIMSRPLNTVRAEAFVYRAIARMDRLNFRHLGVVDDSGGIVGALTVRNLLRQRASAALVLGDEIDHAESVPELGVAWARLPAMAEQLLGEDVDARDIAAVVSQEMRAITRRAAQLAEARMREAGKGGPPAPYAVMVLGSGGRGESLLAADQDNAIVYAAANEDGPEDAWFAELGGHIADMLDAAGIPYCTGSIMAKTRDWRHTVAGWQALIDGWVRRARPQDLLNVDIFYDLRPVHGDPALAQEIWAYAFARGSEAPAFAKLLAETAGEFRPPLGLFGGLKTENGRIDLKRGGLLPVVTAARVLAIRHGVMQHSTPARLNGLLARGIGSPVEFEWLARTHGIVLRRILAQQIEDIHAGVKLSNKVALKPLTRGQVNELKEALGHLTHVSQMVQDLLFAEPEKSSQ